MKTKAIIIASWVLLLCPLRQKAQTFTTGIYAGVTTTSVNLSHLGNTFTNTIQGKGIMGFEGGLFERINCGIFFIKPMILAGYQGGTVTFYNSDGSINSEKFTEGNIEVPVLFGLKFFDFLRIEAGPVYNWIYATHFNGDNSIDVTPSGFGYRIGANVEFGILNLGLAFQGLNNTSNGSTATFASPNELIFSVALCFGGHDDKK
jgi:hypothetical protein